MKRQLALVLTLSGLYACVPGARQDVENQNTKVTMIGTFVSNGGSTDIYFGNGEAPLATTGDKGSFRIEIPRALIEKTEDRRLYFYSSLGEAGVSSEITEFESGTKAMDTVYLSPTVSVEGDILTVEQSMEKPVKEAEIQVGRAKALSDESGHYTIQVPRNVKLPVEVKKSGFVITRANWQTSDLSEERPFYLYTKLGPEGHVRLPVQERLLEDQETKVPLYIESTPSAEYVRVSTVAFTVDPELDSTWQSLKDVVAIKAADLRQAQLYYQFADKDKKVVSGVSVLPLTSP